MRRLLCIFIPLAIHAEDLAKQAGDIFRENCVACHGEALKMSKLDLRTRESMLSGGEHGPALVPGNPEKSRLYRFASGMEQPSMPPGKKLTAETLAVLRSWIESGAPAPGIIKDPPSSSVGTLEERPITAEERRYWAFQPPVRRAAPAVKDSSWTRNAVDTFLLAAMEAKGVRPNPPADRRSLIRRVYLDVTGLPPSPEEVRAFLADNSPDAYEKLVDRLLASTHYGERWARHWLDLVRFADSGGFEYDRDRPSAWRYRDYVIRAFNEDKPYDRFIREQIAGDEMDPASHDALIATGFLRHGLDHNMKNEQTRTEELDDILSTTSVTFLGMTVGCARCHNHKFDPIPQKDYYRIQAVFFSTTSADVPLASAAEIERHRCRNVEIDALEAPVKEERDALEKPYRDRLLEEKKSKLPEFIRVALRTPPERRSEGQILSATQVDKTLRVTSKEVLAVLSPADLARHRDIEARIEALEQQRPAPLPMAMAIGESGPKPLPSYFLHHGSLGSKGSLMSPGVLTVAAKTEAEFPAPPSDAKSSYRRRGFAEWIASPENPLTARVMVNRIWQHHFGEGIVGTPSNFGKSGQPPSHPELLDWLATEFVERGWSIKAMQRLLLTSSAYRMSSDDAEASSAIDPDNRLWWRMPRRRLEGEIIRDSILAVAGTLDRTTGGPGVFPYIDPALWQSSSGRTWPGRPDSDPSTWRRSIYIHSKRTIPVPMLEVFDKPDAAGSCARRNRSTIAPQALILMNNSLIELQARYFAQRLQREAGNDPGAQIDRAFELALARPPSASERQSAIEFAKSGPYGLVDFCQTIFNLNEFVYVP